MYPDAAEILGSSAEASDEDELRWRLAVNAIEHFCRQSFTSGEEGEKRTFDGNGTSILQLDQRLSALEAISMNGNVLDTDAFVIDQFRTRVSYSKSGFGTWASRAAMEMDLGERPRSFEVGQNNVEITGTWGWSDEEYDAELGAVTDALRLTMRDLQRVDDSALAETVKAARSMGIGSLSQGNLNLDLSGHEPDLSRQVKLLLSGTTPSGAPLRFPAFGVGALV